MHLHVSCHVIDLVSLVNDIRLNTLAFKFFTASETQILAYGSLILLQLPLHLFILTLKRWNIGLLLLTSTISGLTLHAWFFIEIHSNAPVIFDLTVNPKKKNFFKKTKYLHLHYIFIH